MRAGVALGGLVSPVLFSLCVNDMPIPSRHVEVADDAAILATFRTPALFVSYLKSYLERWLRECWIVISVSKSTAMLFTCRRVQKPRPVQIFGLASPVGRWSQLSGNDLRHTVGLVV